MAEQATVSAELEPGEIEASRLAGSLNAIRDGGILVVLVLLFLGLALTTDHFLTKENLLGVVDSGVPLGLMAVAGAVVIIAGGFDLSVAAIFLVGSVVSVEISNETSAPVGIAAGLAVGTVLGLVNGLLCTYGRINHFVGTLATSIVFTGIATLIVDGDVILVNDESYANLTAQDFLGIQVSTYILIVFALLCAVLLNKTVAGRRMYAAGGNAEAARLAGIAIARVQIAAYMLSGFAGALAGMILTSRSLSVSPAGSGSMIFMVLAAILIGGISVAGGRGGVWRPIVGMLILGLMANGFNLNGVDPLYQDITSGLIIVGAVAADAWTRRGGR